ncbi:MAG TPA: methionyl-tRNA formyltransferase [Proteobacteria bacterium]|nr:methionyl-tRNA formyltransferase [Pseudomonadota bacterium]
MNKEDFRIVYIGALTGGKKCLQALLDAGENVVAIFTWSDEAAKGRSCFEPMDDIASSRGIPLIKVDDINDPFAVEKVRGFDPDLICVMSWSQIVKKPILQIPTHGAIGMHPTLLPKHRGRAPIPWAIIKGLDKTGVTIFYLDERIDAGDILAQEEIPISFEDTAKTLGQKVDAVAARLLCKVVREIREGTARPRPQDESQATYWPARRPEDGLIDWDQDPVDVYNFIRALVRPYPGAFTFVDGRKLFLWSARNPERSNHDSTPGQILAINPNGMKVATRGGSVWITAVELEGDRERSGSEIAECPELKEGRILGR